MLHGLFFFIALSASPSPVLLAQAAPAPAPATITPQAKEEARHAFKEGDDAFKAGEFEVALKHFVRSYELSHLGELLFDIALCHRALGNWAEARDYYDRYLTEVPNGKSRELAVQQLAEVKQKLAEQEAAKTPPLNTPPPASEVATGASAASHPSTTAIILGSVGVAAAVVAVIGLVEVLSYHNPTQPTPIGDVQSSVNNANTWATVGLISGIGAVAGLSGAALTW